MKQTLERKVIGVVGTNGSGKGTVIKLLKKFMGDTSLEVVSTSDYLKKILVARGVPLKRGNFAALVVELQRERGEDALTRAVEPLIDSAPTDVVLDSVRLPSDHRLIRKYPVNYLIFVDAPEEIRWERARMRQEKEGEGDLSLDDFRAQGRAPNECHILDIGKDAEFPLDNGQSLDSLSAQVQQVSQKLRC